MRSGYRSGNILYTKPVVNSSPGILALSFAIQYSDKGARKVPEEVLQILSEQIEKKSNKRLTTAELQDIFKFMGDIERVIMLMWCGFSLREAGMRLGADYQTLRRRMARYVDEANIVNASKGRPSETLETLRLHYYDSKGITSIFALREGEQPVSIRTTSTTKLPSNNFKF